MRSPDFWWHPRGRIGLAALAGLLLAPFGILYGLVSGWRMHRRGWTVAVPVLCVGNLVAGGAGKTPVAMALAERAARKGRTVAFVVRGYGGRLAGPLNVDPQTHSVLDVGDEALLLARIAPTVVARDRLMGAMHAIELGADFLILDDGFQNPRLAKDTALVVVDDAQGIGNGRVIPAGPLRAPLATQMLRASAVLVLGQGGAGRTVVRFAARRGLPVLHAKLVPTRDRLAQGQRYLAFAGIGRPQKFFDTVKALGGDVAVALPFPDHRMYAEADARRILELAGKENLVPITTEKDAVRIDAAAGASLGTLAERLETVPVRVAFESERAVDQLLEATIARAAARQPRSSASPAALSPSVSR